MKQKIVKGVTHCLLPDCNRMTWPFMNYCSKTHAQQGKKMGLTRKCYRNQDHYLDFSGKPSWSVCLSYLSKVSHIWTFKCNCSLPAQKPITLLFYTQFLSVLQFLAIGLKFFISFPCSSSSDSSGSSGWHTQTCLTM